MTTNSRTTHGALTERSLTTHIGKGREGNRKGREGNQLKSHSHPYVSSGTGPEQWGWVQC